MIHDVVSAIHKGGYEIEVTFDNGKSGVVDFSRYLEKGHLYKKFKDLAFFRSFEINRELGVLTWPGGIDIAPETLYSEATGAPLPAWVEREGEPLIKWKVGQPAGGASEPRFPRMVDPLRLIHPTLAKHDYELCWGD